MEAIAVHFLSPRVQRHRDQDTGSGSLPGFDQAVFRGRSETWRHKDVAAGTIPGADGLQAFETEAGYGQHFCVGRRLTVRDAEIPHGFRVGGSHPI